MSENQWDEQYEEESTEQETHAQQGTGPKQLRDALKREQDANKALRQEFTEFKKTQRDKSLKQLVEGKGLPEKIVNLIGENDDPEEFFAEYGELFGGASSEVKVEETTEEVKSAITPEQRKQLQESATFQPANTGVASTDLKEIDAQLDNIYSADITEAERNARLRAMGAMI